METRYFVHLSGRLKYITSADSVTLISQADEVLRVLAGLIKSVESETGLMSRVAARVTSMLVLSFYSFGLWSKV